MSVYVKERARVCERAYMYVCVCKRESMCVYKRESTHVCVCERENMCVCERESTYVCVCVRERECESIMLQIMLWQIKTTMRLLHTCYTPASAEE